MWRNLDTTEVDNLIATIMIDSVGMKQIHGRNDCYAYYFKQMTYDEAVAIKVCE